MQPVIKWAGGKRQLLNELKEGMPSDIGRYVEPFFGSGALFFDLLPERAIINDNNSQLINLYIQMRDNPQKLMKALDKLQNNFPSEETSQVTYYYDLRENFNRRIDKEKLNVSDAALMIFLNKTCYNGLFRVNASGKFNTKKRKRKTLRLYNKNNVLECSDALKNAKILQGDFAEACKGLKKKDFVYFDSPYFDTFDTYQKNGFPKEEHERLAKLYKRLSDRGIYCMLSNSDNDFIRGLYQDYNIETVPVKRMINCNGEKRTGTEIIVRNF